MPPEQLAAAERLGEYNGLPQNPYRARVAAAQLREAEGDLDAALDCSTTRITSTTATTPPTCARFRPCEPGSGCAAASSARRRSGPAKPRSPPDDELSYLREYEHLTLARVLLAEHETASAERAIGLLRTASRPQPKRAAGAAPSSKSSRCRRWHSRLLATRPAALPALRRAVALAEPAGYVRVFADEGAPMAALLKMLIRKEPGWGYARRLATITSGANQAVLPARAALTEPLSDRELDVLRLLATDLDGPDIARQLHVSLNTMRTHSRNIFRKLQVNNRRSAVRQALELDLLPRSRKP